MKNELSLTNWQNLKLEDIKLPIKGSVVSGPFGSNIGKKFFVDEGIPVIRGNNLTLGTKKFVDEGFVYITKEKAYELRNCEAVAGDIIFTAAGTLGQVGLIPKVSKFPKYIISNKQLRLRCNPDIALPLYLYYWFSSPEMRTYVANQNTGASIPLITLGTLKSLPVVLPPLPTQRRIAAILSAYDELIENNSRRIKILEEMARMIYQEWFVKFRFPGHEQAKFVESPLGMIPAGWEVGRLDDALVLQRGFDLPEKQRQEGIYPIFAATGIVGTHNKAKVKAPGVITGRSGSLGKVLYVDVDYWPLNTALWVKEFKHSTPLFAYFLLSTLHLEKYNSGVAVPTLNRNDVHGLPVLLPPKSLLNTFDSYVISIFELIKYIKNKNTNLRQTRDMLLPKLISGEIDVSDLDIPIEGR